MRVIKNCYNPSNFDTEENYYCVRSQVEFNEIERDVLNATMKLIEKVRNENIHNCYKDDEQLTSLCNAINTSLEKLLDSYENEYDA